MKFFSSIFGNRKKNGRSKDLIAYQVSNKDVSVAVKKATRSRLPDDPPKEKHVKTLQWAVEQGSGQYVGLVLLKRLHGAKDWVTAVKSAVIIHRLVNEAPGFIQVMCDTTDDLTSQQQQSYQLQQISGTRSTGQTSKPKTRIVAPLHMDSFMDTKTAEGKYDFSEWVRAYCRYLDEALDTFAHTDWRPSMERGSESKMRSLDSSDLLEQLPRLQKMQRKMVDCVPRGAACLNENTLFALSLVVREAWRLYKAISEGIINLADLYYDLECADAIKGMEIYNEAIRGGHALQTYFAALQTIPAVSRVIEFPALDVPPEDFLDIMEEHVKELRKEKHGERSKPLRKGAALDFKSPTMSFKSGEVLVFGSNDIQASAPRSNAEEEISPDDHEDTAANLEHVSIDLLAFDAPESQVVHKDEDSQNAPAEQAQVDATVAEQSKSDLDLLSELDFGVLHTEEKDSNTNDADAAESAMSEPSKNSWSNPIPDLLVPASYEASLKKGNPFAD